MATKARKTGKSKSTSSNGEPRKGRASRSRDDDEKHDEVSGGTGPVGTEQLEKRIEDRLSKIQTKREGRKKAKKKSPAPVVEEDIDSKDDLPVSDIGDIEEDEDSAVEVRRLRRRAAAMELDDEDFDEDYGDWSEDDGKNIIDRILSFMPGSRAKEYESLIDKLEHMDEFGKAPDLDKRLEAFMMFLYEKYWRVSTSGLENIPDEGRTLIVANHSGVLPFDGAMMATAIYKFHPARRYARCLIEDWFGQLPFATEFMNAVGQVRACQENAERLLRQEQLVGVFPEGIKGMAKGFKDRYNLARFGRGGVIRLAIRTRTPIVPCAVVGAEEIYIVLGYANWLGKMFGMPLFPISATFPWLGPLGFVPLPTKWSIKFGEMISYDEYDESALKDNVIINRLNRQLRATIQGMLDSMLKKRRSLFF
jgi:1-acyl-sn-glycerol-3-phosphate acyltransferase